MSVRRRFSPIVGAEPPQFVIPKELARHHAFRGFNSGCCGRLVGNLAIVSVLISDTTSGWTAFEKARYKQEVSSACAFLLNNGGRAAGLTIKEQIYLQAEIPYAEERNRYKKTVGDVLHVLGYSSFNAFQASILQAHPEIDTVAVFFVLNKNNRSFALIMKGHKTMNSTRRSDTSVGEYSVIYAKARGSIPFTISHELLHLYGAIDYYYPERTNLEAKNYSPHSIMLCHYQRPEIDDLTKFLVGWKQGLNPNSLLFLKKI